MSGQAMRPSLRQCVTAYLEVAEGAADRELRDITRRFVTMVVQRYRRSWRQIMPFVSEVWDERHGTTPIRVTTARALTVDATTKRSIEYRHSPALLGGAIIEDGDERIDASIQSALRQLRDHLKGSTV